MLPTPPSVQNEHIHLVKSKRASHSKPNITADSQRLATEYSNHIESDIDVNFRSAHFNVKSSNLSVKPSATAAGNELVKSSEEELSRDRESSPIQL
jgi:hypothetical protein